VWPAKTTLDGDRHLQSRERPEQLKFIAVGLRDAHSIPMAKAELLGIGDWQKGAGHEAQAEVGVVEKESSITDRRFTV